MSMVLLIALPGERFDKDFYALARKIASSVNGRLALLHFEGENFDEIVRGFERIYVGKSDFDAGNPLKSFEWIKRALEELKPNTVLTSNGVFWRNFLPALAHVFDAAYVPAVFDVEAYALSRLWFRRLCAGQAEESVLASREKVYATLEADPSGDSAEIPTSSKLLLSRLSSVADVSNIPEATILSALEKSEHAIESARVVFCAGRGIQNIENFRRLQTMAKKWGGVCAATRAVVDLGFASNALQVGQSGKSVHCELYIAVGLSGAVQHLAGLRHAKTVVAVNISDKEAISERADYFLRMDSAAFLDVLD